MKAIDYDLAHPRVWHSPEEIQLARKNVQNTSWGRVIRDEIIDKAQAAPEGRAASFVEMSAEEIRALAPIKAPDGQTYFAFAAHKFESVSNGNVCPIDGSPLEIAGFHKPGKVACEEGHTLPNAEFPDEGSGWAAEQASDDVAASRAPTGTRFWFTATYNGWIANYMHAAVEPLAYAYAVTGEQQYARTAAVLLDVLAESFHTSHGPIVDYPGRSHGRLNRPGYQVGRALRDFTNAADLIWSSGVLDNASGAHPKMSIKEHVAEHMMINGADFIWRNMRGGVGETEKARYDRIFHNGTGDYNEGLLAVGSLLGLEVGYVNWALDGPVSLQNFLSNTVFRDGQYYETATMYQVSFIDWAELAYHVESDKYPNGLNVYDNSRFIDLNVYGPRRFSVAGRQPWNGDSAWPDTEVTAEPFLGDFGDVLHYYARTDDPEQKTSYARLLSRMADGNPNQRLTEHRWALFNIDGEIRGHSQEMADQPPRASELLPAKGWVMYRPESGFDRGAALRFGATLSHGHTDELGLQIFGAGRELSYDPGHKPKRHFMNSFMRQTVTHNTAVVNETSQVPPSDDGGSVEFFTDREGYTVASLSNPQAYAHEGVDLYRRTTAYIDVSAASSYMVDIFRVAGADTVDYSFHGPGVHFDTDLDLSPAAEGSLASGDYCWGDTLRASGEIIGFEEEPFSFNVRPGNGYGFLCGVRRAPGDRGWQAEWRIDESRGPAARLRLTMLPDPDREILVADGPDLLVENIDMDPDEHSLKYVLARDRESETAQYVSVIEAGGGRLPVADVRPLEIASKEQDSAGEPVALRVDVQESSRVDYFLSAMEGNSFTAADEDLEIVTDAAFAMVQVRDGEVQHARMEQGTRLEVRRGSQVVSAAAETAARTGRILDVDYETPSLLVDHESLTGAEVEGRLILIDAPDYSHNSAYMIDCVEKEADGMRIYLRRTTLQVARGEVESTDGEVVVSRTRFPFVRTRHYYVDGSGANEYFDGRQAVNKTSGETTTVAGMDGSYRRVRMRDAGGFDSGDVFVIYDVKPGDRFSVPTSVAR